MILVIGIGQTNALVSLRVGEKRQIVDTQTRVKMIEIGIQIGQYLTHPLLVQHLLILLILLALRLILLAVQDKDTVVANKGGIDTDPMTEREVKEVVWDQLYLHKIPEPPLGLQIIHPHRSPSLKDALIVEDHLIFLTEAPTLATMRQGI